MNDDFKLDAGSRIETIRPRRRLVLLGASNLTRAFPTVVSLAMKRLGGPLSIHAAMGLGRSFGQESRFLEKKYLGIFLSGIWEALEQEKKIPTVAFVTDIGNDLAYEVPVDRLVKWVEGCVDRLQSNGAEVVIADVPLEVLRALTETRYRVVRSLLFPRCGLGLREMLVRVEELSERLHELAKVRDAPLFIGNSDWYGRDPIHPRRANLPRLWSELFGCVAPSTSETPASEKSFAMCCYLRGLRPEKWSTFSFSRSANQPDGRLMDGSEISLY